MIKSPLNYAGNKYKLLDKLLQFFPQNIEIFVDLFGGSGTVAANISCNSIVYNEYDYKIYSIIKFLIETEPNKLLLEIEEMIKNYSLNKTNESSYANLKNDYNNDKEILKLYLLSCYSFSNIVRFNSDDKFNVAFGKRQFSYIMKKNIPLFYNSFNSKNYILLNKDFQDVETYKNSFVYVDPPYLGTGAVYNENNGWTVKEELRLRNYLDDLTIQGIKWALSNDLKKNKTLLDWAYNKYKIIDIEKDYSSCFYNTKREYGETKEVLIINY